MGLCQAPEIVQSGFSLGNAVGKIGILCTGVEKAANWQQNGIAIQRSLGSPRFFRLAFFFFVGRPPLLPQLAICLVPYFFAVAIPPFLAMHRGQTRIVNGWIEQ